MKVRTALIAGIISSVVFTALIYLVSQNLGGFQAILLPDKGADWYYWKLPHPELWATVSMWVLYALHQSSVWYLAYKMNKTGYTLPQGKLGRYNIAFLVVNAVFIGLHMLQTYFFYDGLAQYVPIFTSQYSVIIMLVLVLIMMVARRGLFFGKKVPMPKDGVRGITQTHSYIIAWALVYTFWFHPTEGTWGHLLGFLYMFLLMLQGGMAYTKVHVNIKWITLLEVFVGLHGTIVAVVSGSLIWAMFLFGFMMVFVVTQMYGIIKNLAARITLSAVYLAMVALVYSNALGTGHSIANIYQIVFIPIILYALVFVFVWAYKGAIMLGRKISAGRKKEEAGS
jgi:hypothetical protein